MASGEGIPDPAPAAAASPPPLRLAANPWVYAAASGLGGALVIFILAQLSLGLHTALLIAPFGASCVLVFALPQSPLAQPRNVIGGHLISAAIGVAVFALMGAHPASYALAVGLAIAAMQLAGALHPPAGADPIVAIAGAASWPFLAAPVLAGAVAIVLVAVVFHRLISRRSYPYKPPTLGGSQP